MGEDSMMGHPLCRRGMRMVYWERVINRSDSAGDLSVARSASTATKKGYENEKHAK